MFGGEQRNRASIGINTNPAERLFLLLANPRAGSQSTRWNQYAPITLWLNSLLVTTGRVRLGFRLWFADGDVDESYLASAGTYRAVTGAEMGLDNDYVDIVPMGERCVVIRIARSSQKLPVALEFINLDEPAGVTGRVAIDVQASADYTWLVSARDGLNGGLPEDTAIDFDALEPVDPAELGSEGGQESSATFEGLTPGVEYAVSFSGSLNGNRPVITAFDLEGNPVPVVYDEDLVGDDGGAVIVTVIGTSLEVELSGGASPWDSTVTITPVL